MAKKVTRNNRPVSTAKVGLGARKIKPTLNKFTLISCMVITAIVGSILAYTSFAAELNQPPTASIYGSASGAVGQPLTFTASARDSDLNLSQVYIYVSPQGQNNWYLTQTCQVYKGEANATCSGSWTPNAAGTYDVVVNAHDSTGAKCSGNPNVKYPYAGYVSCGQGSLVTVTIASVSNQSPVASLYISKPYGQTSGDVGQPFTFQASAKDSEPHLSQIDLYVTPHGQSNWSLIKTCPVLKGEANATCSGIWTPSTKGSYDIVVNASDSTGAKCSGNPNVKYPYAGYVSCGQGSLVTVSIQ